MLSQLSKGYGSWTAGYVDPYFGEKKAREHELTFPDIDHESHIHGITVGPRSGRSTALSWATTKRSREPTMDGIPLPKTYTTRKGALQLYVGPEDLEDDDDEEVDENEKKEDGYVLKPKYVEIKRPHGQELINLSLKLGTIERLAMSVLQFGDSDYDHEHTSVSDAKNKAFLKFLHDVDEGFKVTDIDSSVQPGGELNTYLRDLKSSASNHSGNVRMSKSRESLELQAILLGLDNNSNWPMSYPQDGASDRHSVGQFTRPVSRVSSRGASPGYRFCSLRKRYFLVRPPSTPRSTYQVLSAKKVCASIKSGSYLGRPSSRVSVNEGDLLEGDTKAHVTLPVTQPLWTPDNSTDDLLTESRGSFYRGDDENDSEAGKRRGLKERSFLTNNSQLYKGRIARKGDGQHAGEVKVISKGDGDSLVQIEEEFIDMSGLERKISVSNLSRRGSLLSDSAKESNSGSWDEKVSDTQHFIEHEDSPVDKIHDASGVIDVEIDEKEVIKGAASIERVEVRVSSRPGSNRSKGSRLSSRPNSSRSESSYSSSTSTHTPSIITLQSMNTPVSQEKFRSLQKRRNTYAYDPDKGLIRSYNSQRRKSESLGRRNGNHNSLTDLNLPQNVQSGAKRFRNGLHPGLAAYKNSSDWSVNTNNNPDWQTDNSITQNLDATSMEVPDSYELIQPDTKSPVDEVKDNFDFANLQKEKEMIGTSETDQEEYILDNIEECNAEVKQIEEQAEERDAIPDEDDSDLDSTMDEEMIKVILTGQGQTDKDLEVQGESKVEEPEVQIVEQQNMEDTENKDVEEGTDGIDEYNNIEENIVIEDNDEAVEMTEPKGSESNEEEIKVGEDIKTVDDQESVNPEMEDKTVDEEVASDIRSTKSGRKTYSRKSRSGVGSEEDEETGSAHDFTLPTLESDLLEEKDGRNKADISTLDDGQTGFSGSTGSYSDILASDKNSGPASAAQSRPASSVKLSRPGSSVRPSRPGSARTLSAAQSRPGSSVKLSRPGSARTLSAAKNINDEDVNTEEEHKAYVEVVNKESPKMGNADVVDVVLESEDVQNEIKNATDEISKTVKSNLDVNDSDGKSHKPAKVGSVTKSPAVKKDEPQGPAVESKVKCDIPRNTGKTAETADSRVEVKKHQETKKPQSVPKAGKNVAEKINVGKHFAPGRGVPPKLPVTAENKTDRKSSLKQVEANRASKTDLSTKKYLDKTVVEGEGLLDTVSDQKSRLDEVSGDGMVATGDSSGVIKDTTDAHSIVAELDALGLRRKSSKGSAYPLLPPGKRPKPPAEKAKIPDHIAEALNRQTDASIEYLEQDLERMTALVGESLSGPTLEAVGEGLTEEELELAKQILQQKLDEAKGKLEGKAPAPKVKGAKKLAGKPVKKGTKKGKGKQLVEEKSPEELDREAIREKHELEKKQREQEAAELQKKIAEKQKLLKEQNDLTSSRSKELKEEMERLEREAEAIQRAEDEAREILADVRKKQREERETRRKAELERKKQEALERREREKKEMEEKRRKEMEMMEKIADAEMRRRMREEEERRIDEEERLAQERYEEELREAQRLEEEEEERMKEMERQAEEEAMQRLIEEREAAERERRRLREEEEALQEAENLRRLAMEEEQNKLEEQRRRMQEAEEAKREAERQRLLELRRLEEEARTKMQEEIEKRRTSAMSRRDYNLENKMHIDKLRHYQGITRAWTFSYFVHWPRETYERPIGDPDPRKVVKIKNPKPKQTVDNPPETAEAPPTGVP